MVSFAGKIWTKDGEGWWLLIEKIHKRKFLIRKVRIKEVLKKKVFVKRQIKRRFLLCSYFLWLA